jgi:sugar phosphate isomerase/epimerase
MKSAITVSLVPEARGGPFVYWDDLAGACHEAATLGFDAIELFAPGPDAVDPAELRNLLDDNGLSLAAVGTGAGWVKHKLTFTDADPTTRDKALDFAKRMIDFAGPFGAAVIIGSMQGRAAGDVTRQVAIRYLGHALYKLAEHAEEFDTPVLYEPINRYETNLINSLAEATALIGGLGIENVKVLADLFHMNMEEENVAAAIRAAGKHIGHVHFADSNRKAAGMGHTNLAAIVQALRDISFAGYLSAEVFPAPDSHTAAKHTIESFRKHVEKDRAAN